MLSDEQKYEVFSALMEEWFTSSDMKTVESITATQNWFMEIINWQAIQSDSTEELVRKCCVQLGWIEPDIADTILLMMKQENDYKMFTDLMKKYRESNITAG